MLMLFDELIVIRISLLSFFSHLVLNPLGILLRYPEAVVRKCSVKRVFLNISQNSEENNCVGVSFSKNCRPIIAEKRLPHMCFPIKFMKFLRLSFLKNISGRLILGMMFFQAIFYTYSRNNWNFSRKIYFCNNQPLFAVSAWLS